MTLAILAGSGIAQAAGAELKPFRGPLQPPSAIHQVVLDHVERRSERSLELAHLLSTVRERLRREPPTQESRAQVDELRDLEELLHLSLGRGPVWTSKAPDFTGLASLQTGDLVLVRGISDVPVISEVSEVSAGAAGSAYSHVMVAWRDPASTMVRLVESREPHGVRVVDADERFITESARAIVLRIDDPEQRRSVSAHFDRTLPAILKRLPIGYDSWLDDDNETRFDCAQLAAHLLGPGYPAERTRLQPGMAAYAKRAGMPKDAMVLPGDFERDPRFVRVAEAINPLLLSKVRSREAAVGVIIDLRNSGSAVLMADVISKSAERLAEILQAIGLMGPFNSKVVGAAFDLRRDAGPAERMLVEAEARSLEKNGRPLTRVEMKNQLGFER